MRTRNRKWFLKAEREQTKLILMGIPGNGNSRHSLPSHWCENDWANPQPPTTHVKPLTDISSWSPSLLTHIHCVLTHIDCLLLVVTCCNLDTQFLQHPHSPNHGGLHESLLWVGYRLEAPLGLLVVRRKRTGRASGWDSPLYDSAKCHHRLSAYTTMKICWWKIWGCKYDDKKYENE